MAHPTTGKKTAPTPGNTGTQGIEPAKGAGPRHKETRCPIVGIGASAGGLEALEHFLRQVPERCGIAFVIVLHLDPTHKGGIAELLQRVCSLEVIEVKDRMRVRPDCVYVIPPNAEMSILHGVLHLFEPTAPRGRGLPIDIFLRSLAEARQEQAIGVILSGMGSDGTLGLKAIKEKAGLVLVQEPASAKFDAMPRSAIDAGLADLVAPAEELPGRILDYLQRPRVATRGEQALSDKVHSSLEKIVILMRAATGHDFSLYKKSTLYRRIERRMGIHQVDRIETYVRFLRENPQEVEFLFKEFLIGVTSFFRDRAAWEHLRDVVLPEFFDSHPKGWALRAWSVGCSTGEEAYTMAIVFREALDKLKPRADFTLQIFATDLDWEAINQARQGLYPANIAADLSSEQLHRFFVREEGNYRVRKEIREMVTFATQNLIMDPPFTKLDLLVCRNLLIYLAPELQKKLLPLFHYSLNHKGVLFLGSAESIGGYSDLFATLHDTSRLFRRREPLLRAEYPIFPALRSSDFPEGLKETTILRPATNLQALAEQMLLQHFLPAAVLVNNQGDILYLSGRTGRYLEPPVGKANWNIFAMAREGLRFELGIAFQKALRQKEAVVVHGLKVPQDVGSRTVDLTVRSLDEPEALRGMVMIVFTDVPAPRARKRTSRSGAPLPTDARVQELEQELDQARQEVQSTREEMQSSQEELKSANEELQSTNEELQSTNEELTTSREELQSLNEELQTINAEQQSKMDQLSRANDDMRNLLNSTEIITVFLDSDLNVRRFTSGANRLFKLIAGDVGRPLSDIANSLNYPELTDEAQSVLRTLVFSQKEITTTDGGWFLVRIMPYRTVEDVINGVVITFVDITQAKELEASLHAEISLLTKRLEQGDQ